MLSIAIIGVAVFMGALTWGILAQERREERRKRELQDADNLPKPEGVPMRY